VINGQASALTISVPSLGPCGHLQGTTVTVTAAGGCVLVVVRSREGMRVGSGKKQRVMGQCLATGDCQTL
jgi:hypothetical protein